MKKCLINVFYGIEGGSSSEVVSTYKNIEKKENNDILSSLSQTTKKFLGLEGKNTSDYKVKKGKKDGMEGLLFIDNTINGEKVNFLSNEELKELSTYMDEYMNDKFYLENINIFHVLSGEEIGNDVSTTIIVKLSEIDDILSEIDKETFFYDKFKNDKAFCKAIVMELLYFFDKDEMKVSFLKELVDIYDDIIKSCKTKQEKEKVLNFIHGDIANGGNNLLVYKSNIFKKLVNNETNSGTDKERTDKERTDKESSINKNISDISGIVYKLGLDKIDNSLLDIKDIKYVGDNKLEDFDLLCLKDNLKAGQKILVNDLIFLNLYFGDKKNVIKKLFPGDIKENLEGIATKYGYSNFKELKTKIYNENVIVSTVNKELYDNKDMFYELPLRGARLIVSYANNYINPKAKLEFKKHNLFLLKNALSMISDNKREKISGRLNSILEDKGLKTLDVKKIEKIYDKRVENLFLIMNGIDGKLDSKEIGKKMIQNLKDKGFFLKELEGNKEKFYSSLGEFLSKDNISKMKDEFRDYDGPPMQFFLEKIFVDNDFGEYFETGNKNLTTEQQMKIVSVFIGVLTKSVKKDNLLGSIELMKENKEFKKILDSAFDKQFKDAKEKQSQKFKRDVLKLNLEAVLFTVLPKDGVLTQDIIKSKRNKIIQEIKLRIGKSKGKVEDVYIKKVEAVLDDLYSNIPPEGFKFDVEKINEINKNIKFVNKLEKDQKIYEEKGYDGYVSYYENLETEKELLEGIGARKTTVTIDESPFKDRSLDSNKVETAYEEEGGIHTVYMHLPGIKNEVIKVESLSLAESNRELINAYFENYFNFPIEVKGSIDSINKLVSKETDISKNVTNSNDFGDIILKAQNIIFNNFFINGGKKEKDFLKEHKLDDPKLMYKEPADFAKRFSEALKKQVSLGLIDVNLNKYIINLDNVNHNYFDNAEQTKKEVLAGKYDDKFSKQGFLTRFFG